MEFGASGPLHPDERPTDCGVSEENERQTKRRQPMSPTITHGLQYKLMHAAIEKALAPRQFNFTISTEALDRDKDIIKLSAWNLREYEKNPVVLASHAHQRLPVGRSVSIGVRGNSLKA